jgi:alpha-tubulin suppressor-like RCC1 family protein
MLKSGEESGDDVEIRTKNIEPEKVVIQSLYPLETVTSISCSSCHTLAITNLGSVFSCGDGSDGQLGHNSVDSCRELRRIDWFWKGGKEADRIIITQISAGANDTTSHSAAIDSNSILYTWGRSVICGHSDQRRISKSKLYTVTPHRVESLKVSISYLREQVTW